MLVLNVVIDYYGDNYYGNYHRKDNYHGDNYHGNYHHEDNY